jgi:AcrR family transcriptional regulator
LIIEKENMATTEKKSTKKAVDIRSIIVEKYQQKLLLEGKDPASVFAFCKELEISEADFYAHFNDFTQVAAAFWMELFHTNIAALETSVEWEDFKTREKLLSFYFSFFEQLKSNRSYALLVLDQKMFNLKKGSSDMSELKEAYKNWLTKILNEGRGREEIASRSKFNYVYDDLFWYQFLFLLDFWKKDKTLGFESTDEAVEKSVNFSFDLIEKNALDSAFEFGKFIFQNR